MACATYTMGVNAVSDNDFDFDSDMESEGIKNLRKQFKDMTRQNAELQAQLKDALSVGRKATISETLRDLGANPKLSRYIPSEIEGTKDAIKAWLDEDGELFGFKPKSEEAAPEGAAQAQAQQQPAAPAGVPDAMVQMFNRVQNPESFGGVPTQGADAQALEQMQALAAQAGNNFYQFEELQRRLQ